MPNKFSCFIVGEDSLLIKCSELLLKRGHDIYGIVSSNNTVRDWASSNNIEILGIGEELSNQLSATSYDYLFSIANLSVLPDDVINSPVKGAINYHDGPLPKYAGVNATSWAIVNQEKIHGITWHEIKSGVDKGDILKQVLFEVTPDETALSLNLKCFEHGFSSFGDLIDDLASGSNRPTKQNLEDRTYFGKYKRPIQIAIINWEKSSEDISALVRALDFGRYTNPLCLPKVKVGNEYFIVREIAVTGIASTDSPGVVTSIDSEFIRVATATQEIQFEKAFTIEGIPLTIRELNERYSLCVGFKLDTLDRETARSVTEFSSLIAKKEAYWVAQLSSLELGDLPHIKKDFFGKRDPEFELVQVELPETLLGLFDNLGHNPQSAFGAAFAVFIGRHCGKNDFNIGYSDMKLFEELREKDNLFARCVPQRVTFDSKATFVNSVPKLTEDFRKTVENKTFSNDIWGRYPDLNHFIDKGSVPLFPINIAFFDDPQRYKAHTGSDVTFIVSTDIRSCHFLFNSLTISKENISLLKEQFIGYLEEVAGNPGKEIGEISILSSDERKLLLEIWNDTQVYFPTTKCIHDLFEEQVLKTPGGVAVVRNGKSHTYNELNGLSNQLARRLQELGVEPGSLVGIYLHRSLDMIVALMGTLKAGCAYVPLDPVFPKDRTSYMIEDSSCAVIITEKQLREELGSSNVRVLTIDEKRNEISKKELENLDCGVTPEDLAYVIYTSGSTGKPKGVMVEHRNVVNFLMGMDGCIGYEPKVDKVGSWLAVTSLSFDISVLEIFWNLTRGFKIFIYSEEHGSQVSVGASKSEGTRVNGLELQEHSKLTLSIPDMIIHYDITHFQCTPSMASMLMYDKAVNKAFGRLKKLLIGGETLPGTLAVQLKNIVGGDVINMYGPTETTVWSTSYKLHEEKLNIPIGRPIANTQIYIVDEHLQPVPIGVPGELMIAGAGVVRGYINRPQLTAERFIDNPFTNAHSSRLYKTGDLARYLPDGNIEFLGRMDLQVKLRGYRIELGEIEAVLNDHPSVHESVVIARVDTPGQKRLVAYAIPRKGKAILPKELRIYVREKLPGYMIPAHIIILNAFPQTPNRKIDRKALPPPGKKRPGQSETFEKPRTHLEEALVDIWSEALGVQPVGRNDNFFDLGGDSLTACGIMLSIRKTCDVDLSLHALFRAPTVASLSEMLEHAFTRQAESGYTIGRSPDGEPQNFRTPESNVERRIAQIWSSVLEVEDIGLHDNFFDLGGHSLTGVQIAFQIQMEFGIDVPLATFFNAPTVAMLGRYVEIELDGRIKQVSDLDKVSQTLGQIEHLLRELGDSLYDQIKQESLDKHPLGDLYEKINGLSSEVRRHFNSMIEKKEVDVSEFQIVSRDPTKPIPLSYVQSRFWFLQKMDPDQPVYNIAVSLRINGSLDVKVLTECINLIIQRHEILRTTFPTIDGMPQQVVNKFSPLKIPVEIIADPEEELAENALRDLLEKEARTPFELDSDSFFKIKLYESGVDEHILLLVSHHLVMDGWSIRIFMRELGELYPAKAQGLEPALPDLPVQYADYASWEQGFSASKEIENHVNYWRSKLHGAQFVLDIPTDFQRPPIETFPGETLHIKFPKSLTDNLRKLSQENGVTLYMTLLASFQTLLHKYSRQKDLLVGTAVANINRSEIQNLVGSFSNNILLRAQFHDDPSFAELLKQVRDTLLEAHDHQDLPYERLIEELQPERALSRNPLFQAAFIFHQSTLEKYLQFDELTFESIPISLGSSRFDVTLEVDDDSEGIVGFLEFKKDLFEKKTIERMAEHLLILLECAVEDPSRTVSELNILSDEEKAFLLEDLNQTAKSYPDKRCVHQLFEGKVAEVPDKIAVVFEKETLTYNVLNEKANRVAHYLIELGSKPEDLVGICVERSLDMIVGLLGILKAGCAYVPMDPSFPSDRLNYILKDAKIPTLITQDHLTEMYAQFKGNIVKLDGDTERIDVESAGNPKTGLLSENLAYVIHTSGSTGKPKGVQVSHRALLNFLLSMQQEPGLTEEDRLVSVTTISFDISILEFFLPLICGGSTIIASKYEAADGKLLFNLLKKSKATVLQATPATWKLLLEAGWRDMPELKMLCGGEAFPRDLADQLLERGGSLWNMYGPTETTIWSSVKKLEPGEKQVLIGPPIANTQFYVLDDELNPVPAGIAGELMIGGDGLAIGYLGRPELTSERFIGNPFDSTSNSRLYRTGDLVRFRYSGDTEFLGRLDFQVKIRGFRIELGEIEHALNEYPPVKEAVIVARDDKMGNQRLIGYVIPVIGQELKVSEMSSFLKEKLPDYMIPSLFITCDEFPLTPNAKIDRKALPDPESSMYDSEVEKVFPRDELELQLGAIWQKLLGIKSIGVHDNFFDIGGHSLLAARLFAQIDKKLGIILPLATLFQTPTIAGIAGILRQKDWQPSWSSLVPIRTEGLRPPLFLIHGAEGNVLLYRDVAHYLGPEQPVYGLQAQGLDGIKPIEKKFENMAANYIREIRSVQPSGPYLLGGYCLGGALAYEMAQQLKGQGEKVALVAMLETYNIQEISSPLPFYYKWYQFVQNVTYHMENFLKTSSKDRFRFLKQKAYVEWDRFKIKSNIAFSKVTQRLKLNSGLNYTHLLIDKVNDQAHAEYKPKVYDGSVTLFKPRRDFVGLNDSLFGWGDYAIKGVDVINMPFGPKALLNEPFVKLFAEKLAEEIEQKLSNGKEEK